MSSTYYQKSTARYHDEFHPKVSKRNIQRVDRSCQNYDRYMGPYYCREWYKPPTARISDPPWRNFLHRRGPAVYILSSVAVGSDHLGQGDRSQQRQDGFRSPGTPRKADCYKAADHPARPTRRNDAEIYKTWKVSDLIKEADIRQLQSEQEDVEYLALLLTYNDEVFRDECLKRQFVSLNKLFEEAKALSLRIESGETWGEISLTNEIASKIARYAVGSWNESFRAEIVAAEQREAKSRPSIQRVRIREKIEREKQKLDTVQKSPSYKSPSPSSVQKERSPKSRPRADSPTLHHEQPNDSSITASPPSRKRSRACTQDDGEDEEQTPAKRHQSSPASSSQRRRSSKSSAISQASCSPPSRSTNNSEGDRKT